MSQLGRRLRVLLYEIHSTTIVSKSDSVLWALVRAAFRLILLEANTKKMTMYEGFLANVSLLESLTKGQRARVIDALEEVTFKKGEHIIEEGEHGHYLYIIVSGEVSVTTPPSCSALASPLEARRRCFR